MHTFKRYDAAGIKNKSVLNLLNPMMGGGSKRGRVEEAEDINIKLTVHNFSTLNFLNPQL